MVMKVLFQFFVICIVEVTLGLDEGGKVPRRSYEEGELRASMKTVALHRVRIPHQRLALTSSSHKFTFERPTPSTDSASEKSN